MEEVANLLSILQHADWAFDPFEALSQLLSFLRKNREQMKTLEEDNTIESLEVLLLAASAGLRINTLISKAENENLSFILPSYDPKILKIGKSAISSLHRKIEKLQEYEKYFKENYEVNLSEIFEWLDFLPRRLPNGENSICASHPRKIKIPKDVRSAWAAFSEESTFLNMDKSLLWTSSWRLRQILAQNQRWDPQVYFYKPIAEWRMTFQVIGSEFQSRIFNAEEPSVISEESFKATIGFLKGPNSTTEDFPCKIWVDPEKSEKWRIFFGISRFDRSTIPAEGIILKDGRTIIRSFAIEDPKEKFDELVGIIDYIFHAFRFLI
ncbi:MAG: hypothetical protein ACE5OZ_21830 [Candidatus Heimdallarchaeota archaeon]